MPAPNLPTSQAESPAESLASPYMPPPVASPTFSRPRSAASAPDPNPSPPALLDDHQWIQAYLKIHRLSSPSYRYMYILWLIIIFTLLAFALLHSVGSRSGALGSLWSKWSLRRRTWRKQHSLAEARRLHKPHKQPLSLPSNAQLLSIAVLYAATILLCFLGPDYIAPGTHIWDFSNNLTAPAAPAVRAALVPRTPSISQPAYTIPKAWWTTGGRNGTIAFALFPLCILFALKAPPFALFALPFLMQLYSDKLSFIHKWSGRLIWLVTALHVALWGVQLGRDKRATDIPISVWIYAFQYEKFLYGCLAFIFLTLLVALSLRPVRVEFYEMFYIFHVLLIPLTLIFSALHFPPIGWWCWGTLILWGAERLWRLVRLVRINGIVGGTNSRRSVPYVTLMKGKDMSWQEASMPAHFREESGESYAFQSDSQPMLPTETYAVDVKDTWKSEATMGRLRSRPLSAGQETIRSFQTGSEVDLLSHAARPGVRTSQYSSASAGEFPPMSSHVQSVSQAGGFGSSRRRSTPPPGYAHAALLPGRTVRLRLITPHDFTWAPGQHVLLSMPSVSRLTSHPFTIASVCDDEAASDAGREIIFLIRARTGFTKDLWSHVEQLEASGKSGDIPFPTFFSPKGGVLLRAYVDGPFGSTIRNCWTSYSTVLVVAGGSGVSFAIAVLEYACMCMAGRSGKHLGGRPGGWGHNNVSQINRVRFVWIVREFSHIQWVGSQIRRCMDMVPASALQVDIYVTNVAAKPPPSMTLDLLSTNKDDGSTLVPSNPFSPERDRRNMNISEVSLDSGILESTPTHALPAEVGYEEDTDAVSICLELGHEVHVLDLTNFDGEDDSALPGERQFSRRLRKEGMIRRATRRMPHGPRAKPERLTGSRVSAQAPHSPMSKHPPQGFRPSTPSEDIQSPNSTAPLRNPALHGPLTPTPPVDSSFTPVSPYYPRRNSFVCPDPGQDSRSASPVPSHKPNAAAYRAHARSEFGMDEAEAEDVSIVSEMARPGRAKIDRVIADEAGRSRGPMVVACCGPTSLTAMVRKTVAAQIDPVRILRGDTRASIALVSEDFEW